eukprot:TRINITY_DN35761_c0_g1_i1.p1 TRINITY_DN35761_c0_g1~~TRINITY_DN35761_c0_g1_i1.p1  ORF type:complete len:371 (+),score=119.92 TRINITY_DN35761_c0_g1_i1:52-1113(+)
MELSSSETLPWVEKYRPKTIDDVLAHHDIIATITKLIDVGKMPHLLLYGPAGTGKTSTIMACARRLYGSKVRHNMLELNASDERGIGTIRGQVKEFASTQRLNWGGPKDEIPFKMIVLDEADQLTNDAQSALRRVMEQYSRHVRFCIVCNHVNRIMPAIQSRCTRFRFGPLPKRAVATRLREIAEAEKCPFTDDGLAAVYRLSHGDMRRALNIMQGAVMSRTSQSGGFTEAEVYAATGSPSPAAIREILELLVNRPVREAAEGLRALTADRGIALTDVVRDLAPWIIKMDLAADVQCWAIDRLAEIEYQLAFSCEDAVQAGGVVGVMQMVRAATTEQKRVSELLVGCQMDDLV